MLHVVCLHILLHIAEFLVSELLNYFQVVKLPKFDFLSLVHGQGKSLIVHHVEVDNFYLSGDSEYFVGWDKHPRFVRLLIKCFAHFHSLARLLVTIGHLKTVEGR